MFSSTNKDTNVILKIPYMSILIDTKKNFIPILPTFVALAKATLLSK